MNNIFDVLGPIMIGPSSSHTAGVVRIGNAAKQIIGGIPEKVIVKFAGSFSTTYTGHGSDKAIIGGLLGFKTDDERVRDSIEIAKEQGIEIVFTTIVLPSSAHPNTIMLELVHDNQTYEITGISVGGGNFAITSVDGTEIYFDGKYDTLLIAHQDEPGRVAEIGDILAKRNINIAQMKLWRSLRGGDALMLLEVDQPIWEDTLNEVKKATGVSKVTFIPGLM